jgi:hypothetical protein
MGVCSLGNLCVEEEYVQGVVVAETQTPEHLGMSRGDGGLCIQAYMFG